MHYVDLINTLPSRAHHKEACKERGHIITISISNGLGNERKSLGTMLVFIAAKTIRYELIFPQRRSSFLTLHFDSEWNTDNRN